MSENLDRFTVDRYNFDVDKVFTSEILELLGAEPSIVEIYELIAKQNSSALELAEKSGISRTQVYRLLDQLIEFDLVVKSGSNYQALPLESFIPTLLKKQLIIEQTILNIRKSVQI